MKEVEKIQIKKDELRQQLVDLSDREYELLIEDHYPEFKKKEGNYYKRKNSTGGSDRKEWFIYYRLNEVIKESIHETSWGVTFRFKGVSFEIVYDNSVVVNPEFEGYFDEKDFFKIGVVEYNLAVSGVKQAIKEIEINPY